MRLALLAALVISFEVCVSSYPIETNNQCCSSSNINCCRGSSSNCCSGSTTNCCRTSSSCCSGHSSSCCGESTTNCCRTSSSCCREDSSSCYSRSTTDCCRTSNSCDSRRSSSCCSRGSTNCSPEKLSNCCNEEENLRTSATGNNESPLHITVAGGSNCPSCQQAAPCFANGSTVNNNNTVVAPTNINIESAIHTETHVNMPVSLTVTNENNINVEPSLASSTNPVNCTLLPEQCKNRTETVTVEVPHPVPYPIPVRVPVPVPYVVSIPRMIRVPVGSSCWPSGSSCQAVTPCTPYMYGGCQVSNTECNFCSGNFPWTMMGGFQGMQNF